MSTWTAETLACAACGAANRLALPASANVARRPEYRSEILARTFMRVACERCGELTTVERPLLYTDLEHGLFVVMYPEADRDHHRRLAALTREVFRRAFRVEAPAVVVRTFRALEPRLVFGLEALREKVLANEHGLDDRALEALKHLLLGELPGAAEAGVEDLVLVEVSADALAFAQLSRDRAGPATRPLLTVRREVFADLAAARALLVATRWLEGPWVHRGLITTAGTGP